MNTAAAAERQQAPGKSLTPLQEARGQIDNMEGQFKMALPAHVPAERFMRVVMTALGANQDLLTKCSRQSLLAAAMKAAQDGLLPDGRDAALVVFGTQAQYMPMIGGILKKIRNSGELKSITAQIAYEKDRFFYKLGDEEVIEHEPFLDGDRGKPRLAYAIARTKDGGVYREIMTVADIEKVRAVSRAKNNGPWKDWWDEMAKKTVMRRLSKRLPMSTDLDDLMRRDDELYDLKGAREEAVAANGGRPHSLVGRLDVLASASDRETVPLVERQRTGTPHDPATGEVKDVVDDGGDDDQDADAADGDEQQKGAGQGQVPATQPDQPQDPERTALMHKLRGKAQKGRSALRLAFGNLVPAENERLSSDDRKYLEGVADDAEREKAGAS